MPRSCQDAGPDRVLARLFLTFQPGDVEPPYIYEYRAPHDVRYGTRREAGQAAAIRAGWTDP